MKGEIYNMVTVENEINNHPKYGNLLRARRCLNRHLEDLKRKIKRYRYGKNTISGVYYDNEKKRLMWYSYHNKYLRRQGNRKVRQYKEEIQSGSSYRKIFDYKYLAY